MTGLDTLTLNTKEYEMLESLNPTPLTVEMTDMQHSYHLYELQMMINASFPYQGACATTALLLVSEMCK